MPFRAVHREWGTIFAHLPDLGCGRAWESIWRARPPAPIVCDECGHPMYAKLSRTGMRFFAHAAHSPQCGLAGESIAHRLLKLELATAAVAAGAHAELEVPAADGSWRADVLAGDHTGAWKVALEAQLAPITADDIRARTDRMRADQLGVCWFSDRPRPPWLGTVPSIRLAQSDSDHQLLVVEGLYRFVPPCWQAVAAVALVEFLGWVFTGKAVPHHVRRAQGLPRRQPAWIWTAPAYIQAEEIEIAEDERHQRNLALDKQRRRARIDERNKISRAQAVQDATALEVSSRSLARADHLKRLEQRRRPVLNDAIALLANDYGIEAQVGWSVHKHRLYAWGVPLVNSDGVPVAVFEPIPADLRGEAFRLLAGLLLLFPTGTARDQFLTAMRKKKRQPIEGFRTDVCATAPEDAHGDQASAK